MSTYLTRLMGFFRLACCASWWCFGSPDLVRGVSEPDFFPLSTNLSSCGDCSISPIIFVVVVGLRELICDVSGPDYPLSTDMSSSWRVLPRCMLLAWWLSRPLTLRRDVPERALSAVDVPVERVASVAVLPDTCVVVLRKHARGRDVSEPFSSVVGDLSSSWRLFFLLLDTCWGNWVVFT
jgi:hypothetical protein